MSLSWVAVRRGKIYCAPACGSNCTFAAFSKATELASKLCAKLGPEWEPRITENMGWHYRAVALGGLVVVNPCEDEYYAAYCSSGDGVCMESGFISGYHGDPRKAVDELIEKITAQHDRLHSILRTVSPMHQPKHAKRS